MFDTQHLPDDDNVILNGHASGAANGHNSGGANATPSAATVPSVATVPTPAADDASLHLDAQSQGAKASSRGAGNLNDPLARPRNDKGLPQPRPLVYFSPGLLSGRPIQETTLPKLLELLAEHTPARSEWLGIAYEQGLRFNKEQLDDLDRLLREEMAQQNLEISRRNKALTALQRRLERERDAETKPDREALKALDEPLRQAHAAAADAAANAGGDYDAESPTADCVLRARPMTLEVVTGAHALPWTPTDNDKRIPGWQLHLLEGGVGFAIGLSMGLVASFFEPDNVGKKLGELLVAIALGYVAALGGGWAARGSTRRASERYWLARFGSFSPFFWIPSAVFTTMVNLTLIVAEVTIESRGLLGAAQLKLQNEGGTALPWFIFYVAGLLITVGYVVTQSNEGSFDGRRDVCLHRAQWLQHEEFTVRETQERDRKEVQAALHTLGRVREVLHHVSHLQARIADIAGAFNSKIAALENFKREPLTELSAASKELLRDAHDAWNGSNSDWHAALHKLLDEIEPQNGGNRRRTSGTSGQRVIPPRPGVLARLRDWWQRVARR